MLRLQHPRVRWVRRQVPAAHLYQLRHVVDADADATARIANAHHLSHHHGQEPAAAAHVQAAHAGLQVLAQQRSIHDLLRELTPDPGQPADQFTRFLHPLIEEGYEEIDDLDDLVVDDEYDKLMSYNRKYKSNPQKRSAMMWSELRGMNMTYSEAHRISEMATEWASRYMFRLLLDSHKNVSELHEYEYTPSGVYRHLIPWQEDDPHNTLTYHDRATPFADPRTQRRMINALIAEEIEDIEDLSLIHI